MLLAYISASGEQKIQMAWKPNISKKKEVSRSKASEQYRFERFEKQQNILIARYFSSISILAILWKLYWKRPAQS